MTAHNTQTSIQNNKAKALIEVRDLSFGYGDYVVQRDLTFSVYPKDVFVVMGGSGCGKSTLLRSLVGLLEPLSGAVLYEGQDFWRLSTEERHKVTSSMGLLFQNGALWTSMTLAENVALPLEQNTNLCQEEIREQVRLKLSLVGLAGFEDYMPSEISGGMRKRAGLARAIALDPKIVFFDEPSAGLDPISAGLLDDLILELKESLDMTIVVVTHDLDSIFNIASNAIYLDNVTHTMLTVGKPHDLRNDTSQPDVMRFLRRGKM